MRKRFLKSPTNFFKRVFHFLYGLCVVVFLATPLAVCNFIQLGFLVVIRPFSQDIFRKLNCHLAAWWWGLCVSVSSFSRVNIAFEGDEIPEEENALVICNHQGMTDIVILLALGKMKRRAGNMKWFVKDIIKFFPGVGWGLNFLDTLFVKRTWHLDRETIDATFAKITKFKLPAWVLSFPEGSRVTDVKHALGVAYAKKAGFEPLKHHLTPRTKGFVAQVNALRGHLNVLYDVVIAYPDGVPTLWQFIQGLAVDIKVRVNRFELSGLPTDDEAIAAFLRERFRQKDEYMDRFKTTGAFIG